MASFRFSAHAEADLLSISKYTAEEWGHDQAIRYLGEIENCCRMLADNPLLGRRCDRVRPRLRRMEHRAHVIFFRQDPEGGIIVSRILHKRMLPAREVIEGGEP